MLTAYFDASGSADGTEVLVVAGFLSDNENWIGFETEWNDVLNLFGRERASHERLHYKPQAV